MLQHLASRRNSEHPHPPHPPRLQSSNSNTLHSPQDLKLESIVFFSSSTPIIRTKPQPRSRRSTDQSSVFDRTSNSSPGMHVPHPSRTTQSPRTNRKDFSRTPDREKRPWYDESQETTTSPTTIRRYACTTNRRQSARATPQMGRELRPRSRWQLCSVIAGTTAK